MAQTSTGVISGRIVDPQGSAVPAADVVLTQQLTGVKIATKSDNVGDFVFPSVLPGQYRITVETKGFKRFQKRDLVLSASERLSAGDLALEIGAITEAVTVTAEATAVQTTSQERSAVLNDKQMSLLSTPGRDYMTMLKMLPGVALSDSNGASTLGTSGVPMINGGRTDYSAVNVDGVVGNNRGLGTTENEINLDAVAEVKVLMGNYQAEYGKNSGAIVNVVTKGGTQEYHGAAYWYKRHEMFNANTFFNNKNNVPKSRYRYNTVGYNLGGPISFGKKFNANKDKLFFFFSQEHQPNTRQGSLRTYTMPTDLERAGDFSKTLQSNGSLITIKDPLSGLPFSGNLIPSNRLNSDMQKLLGILPMPNFTNRAVSKGNYNYVQQFPIDNPIRQDLLRVDYSPTQKWRTYFRGMNMYVNNSGTDSTANTNNWGIVQAYNTTNPNVGGNVTYMASPTLVNELSMGLSRWTEDQIISSSELARIQRDKIGMKLSQFYPKDNPLNVVPGASFSGVTNAPSIGFDARFPMHDVVDSFSISDGLTKVLHSHTLKAGVYWEWGEYLQAHHANSGSAFTGLFNFSNDANNPYNTGYPYSTAMLGYFQQYSEVTSLVDYWPITHVMEWYLQDSWKVSKRLTLEYGIRFSYDMPTYLKNDVGGQFITSLYDRKKAPVLFAPALDSKNARVAVDPLTGTLYPAAYIGRFVPGSGDPNNGSIKAGSPGYPRGFMQSNGLLAAPRFGLAWDPFGTGKTAIRVGAGIFNNARPRSGQTGDMAFNPPVQSVPVQYYGDVNTFLNAAGTLAPANVNKVLQSNAKLISAYNITAGFQRSIPFRAVVDVAYVGNLGRHLGSTVQINGLAPGTRFLASSLDKTTASSPLPDACLRPYYGYGNLPYLEFSNTSSYHALQAQVKRSFSRGLQLNFAWTWSKAMNYGDGYNDGVSRFYDRRVWNYGPSSSDRTHTVVANWVWDIPKASRLWNVKPVQWVFDNWQYSGILSLATGMPKGVTLSLTDGADLTGGTDGATALIVSNPTLPSGERTIDRYFNPAAFARPAKGNPGSGSFATNFAYRGPGVNNWDMTFVKTIPVREKVKFQFRWEMYNAFNHTQFTGANSTAQFDAKGTLVNAAFGQLNAARDPRIQQMALRVSF